MKSFKKFALMLIVSIAICSCASKKEQLRFEIINSTTLQIDSLKICTRDTDNQNYTQLSPVSSVTYFLDMTNIPKVDGDYILKYSINGKQQIKQFGYYTNGFPLEKQTMITISLDSVKIEEGESNF